MKRRITLVSILAACALLAAACSTVVDTADEAVPDMDVDMNMDAAGHMNMGDPDATPADEVRGAELESAEFQVLDTAPDGYESILGTAQLARHDGGTTVTVEIDGLPANTEFISHVHAGTCDEGGGAHFMFDVEGPPMPPNEIHLGFTSDSSGRGFMTAQNDKTVSESARSVVVHPIRSTTAKVACAEF